MNFQVPQFIEVEDKIFGPLTFRQFAYVAGGAGMAFLIWVYVPIFFISVVLIIPVLALALALAFYKVNDRPFILILEAWFRYLFTKKLYLWQKKTRALPAAGLPAPAGPRALVIPKLSQSKLKDLAWSLDVKEKVR